MTDTLAQYKAVREQIGLLDRSMTGKLAITGPDRFSWLQGMVSNDVRRLQKERGQEDYSDLLPACLLDATGHLVSDLTVINITGNNPVSAALNLSNPNFILVEIPRVNLEKVAALFDRYLIMEDVEISDVSDQVGCLSLQGPDALRAWNTPQPETNPVVQVWYESCFFLADHTGSGGVDSYLPMHVAKSFLALLQQVGIREILGMPEIGAEAAEVLRVEAGIPKYGADMDESVIALEAGLGPTHISLTKGCYVGQEIIARIDSRGHTNRALTGFVLSGGSVPQPGDKIFAPDADSESGWKETGRLTSVISASPAMNNLPIALGYARHENREPGNVLRVGSLNSSIQAEVTELPFYRKPAL